MKPVKAETDPVERDMAAKEAERLLRNLVKEAKKAEYTLAELECDLDYWWKKLAAEE